MGRVYGKCIYPIDNSIVDEPTNSPGPNTFNVEPKIMLHSLASDIEQKGRTKS